MVVCVSFCPVSEVQKVSQQDNEQSSIESRDSNKYQTGGMYFVLLIFICRWNYKIVFLTSVKCFFIGTGIYTGSYTNWDI